MKDVQQLFQEFLWESEFSRKVRPDTLKNYKNVFATFTTLIPGIQLNDINTTTITTFFKIIQERKRIIGKGIIKQGVKKSTIATYWSKLSAFFGWLERNGHIQQNPFSQMKYPAPSYEDKKFLKKNEVEKILTAIHIHHNNDLLILKRNIALFNILLFCGLRREELMLLQIRDIDLDRKTLTVRAETSKSGSSRQIPLTAAVITSLKDYLMQRKQHSTPQLFVSSVGDRPFSYDGLKHLVLKLNAASGIRFHLHQFRHTFAMNFLKQSNNLFKLKQLMGHKDIRMTAVYLRCMPIDEMRGDLERMSIDRLI